MEMVRELLAMDKRQLAHQTLSFGLIVCSALVIWKCLMLFTGSESPIVVVLSGSMEPAFYRGDLLFLSMSEDEYKVGDVVVFKLKGRDIPIVHRVLRAHLENQTGDIFILTKGDANAVDDRGLYHQDPPQLWLEREHIIGRARGFLPYVGMVTIIMNDYPWLKFALIGVLALFVLTSKEN